MSINTRMCKVCKFIQPVVSSHVKKRDKKAEIGSFVIQESDEDAEKSFRKLLKAKNRKKKAIDLKRAIKERVFMKQLQGNPKLVFPKYDSNSEEFLATSFILRKWEETPEIKRKIEFEASKMEPVFDHPQEKWTVRKTLPKEAVSQSDSFNSVIQAPFKSLDALDRKLNGTCLNESEREINQNGTAFNQNPASRGLKDQKGRVQVESVGCWLISKNECIIFTSLLSDFEPGEVSESGIARKDDMITRETFGFPKSTTIPLIQTLPSVVLGRAFSIEEKPLSVFEEFSFQMETKSSVVVLELGNNGKSETKSNILAMIESSGSLKVVFLCSERLKREIYKDEQKTNDPELQPESDLNGVLPKSNEEDQNVLEEESFSSKIKGKNLRKGKRTATRSRGKSRGRHSQVEAVVEQKSKIFLESEQQERKSPKKKQECKGHFHMEFCEKEILQFHSKENRFLCCKWLRWNQLLVGDETGNVSLFEVGLGYLHLVRKFEFLNSSWATHISVYASSESSGNDVVLCSFGDGSARAIDVGKGTSLLSFSFDHKYLKYSSVDKTGRFLLFSNESNALLKLMIFVDGLSNASHQTMNKQITIKDKEDEISESSAGYLFAMDSQEDKFIVCTRNGSLYLVDLVLLRNCVLERDDEDYRKCLLLLGEIKMEENSSNEPEPASDLTTNPKKKESHQQQSKGKRGCADGMEEKMEENKDKLSNGWPKEIKRIFETPKIAGVSVLTFAQKQVILVCTKTANLIFIDP